MILEVLGMIKRLSLNEGIGVSVKLFNRLFGQGYKAKGNVGGVKLAV